jgi:hypothetical protein
MKICLNKRTQSAHENQTRALPFVSGNPHIHAPVLCRVHPLLDAVLNDVPMIIRREMVVDELKQGSDASTAPRIPQCNRASTTLG